GLREADATSRQGAPRGRGAQRSFVGDGFALGDASATGAEFAWAVRGTHVAARALGLWIADANVRQFRGDGPVGVHAVGGVLHRGVRAEQEDVAVDQRRAPRRDGPTRAFGPRVQLRAAVGPGGQDARAERAEGAAVCAVVAALRVAAAFAGSAAGDTELPAHPVVPVGDAVAATDRVGSGVAQDRTGLAFARRRRTRVLLAEEVSAAVVHVAAGFARRSGRRRGGGT